MVYQLFSIGPQNDMLVIWNGKIINFVNINLGFYFTIIVYKFIKKLCRNPLNYKSHL